MLFSNVFDAIFLVLSITLLITGTLVNYFEDMIHPVLIKVWSYGSYAYRGKAAKFVRSIEMPKAFYSHFYIFASALNTTTLLYMSYVYSCGIGVNENVVYVLRILVGDKEPVSMSTAYLSMSLFTLQCLRRLHETLNLQVFAKTSKMNLVHYIMAIVHYAGCVGAIVGHAPMFRGEARNTVKWLDSSAILTALGVAIFLWASYEQHRSHVILAHLRRDTKTGEVLREDYEVPRGRMFYLVSSPHRFCEILVYAALFFVQLTQTSFLIFLWVLTNQCEMAIRAHKWYKREFRNYPSYRKAIIPILL